MASLRSAARKPYSRPAARGDVDGQWVHDKAPTGPRGHITPRGPAAAATGPASHNKLVVSNLHYDITPKDLISVFGQIGTLVREPLLRYDRSGRSTGSAIISFETSTEATRAKKQFDGYLAKGQPMSITFDTMPPRAPRRRATSAPTTASLLNRIEKPPLVDRISVDDSKIPAGPRAFVGGPTRTKGSRGSASVRPPRVPKKPKTAAELDQELDAFMGDTEAAETQGASAGASQDVDMV